MITLIHGDDELTARKALDDLKLKYEAYERIFFDGTKITLTDFVTATQSLSLFEQKKLIVIENLLTSATSGSKDSILNFVKKNENLPEIIFFEQKEISKLLLKKYFEEAKIIYCQLPQILFKFLDSIGGRSTSEVLSMFNRISREREAEFILSMLIRQWRYLIIASDLGEAGFSGMPSWQAYKFIKQARYFNLDKLTFSYRQLLSYDQKIKSGLTAYVMKQLLDIFLISLYHQN